MAKVKSDDVVYETEAPKNAKTEKVPPKARYDFSNLNSLAVVSIASAVTGFGAAAAVITGHVSLAQIKKTGQNGRGLAIAGVAAGYAIIGLWILSSVGLIALSIWGVRNGAQFDRNFDGNGMMGFGHDDNRGGMFQQGQVQVAPGDASGTTQPSA